MSISRILAGISNTVTTLTDISSKDARDEAAGRLLLQDAATPLLDDVQRGKMDPFVDDEKETVSETMTPEELFTLSLKKLTEVLEDYEYQMVLLVNTQISQELGQQMAKTYYEMLRAGVYDFTGTLNQHLQTPNNSQGDEFLRAFLALEKAKKEKFDPFFANGESNINQKLNNALVEIKTKKIDIARLMIVDATPVSSKKIVTEELFTQQIAGMPKLFGDFYRAVRDEKDTDKQKLLAAQLQMKVLNFEVIVTSLNSSTPSNETFAASVRNALAAEQVVIEQALNTTPAHLLKYYENIHARFTHAFDSIIAFKGLDNIKSDIAHEIKVFQDNYLSTALQKLGRVFTRNKP